ncbi:NAD(P)/FAD-dependent oxidoreductase [Mesorhizobium sp. ANAO-SY3R2]|uniref:NAD(P)/FAD-dependent oxidoreductase n=1 Tax=Mesorhizobium sp. ANAO-SY3R2 TaxID=3166644 RepID=UPI00366F7133
MSKSDVVILGASHSGVAAAAALRGSGFGGTITIVTREGCMPYHRPPLSKEGLSTSDYAPALLRPASFYETNRIALEQGAEIASLDTSGRALLADDGRRFEFGTLVLACGAEPRRLPAKMDPDGAAIYLRTMDDFLLLKDRLAQAKSVAIVGGGLIGLEIAAMAVSRGLRTTLIEAGDRLMGRTVSGSISGYLLDRHQAKGLDVRLATTVTSIRRDDARGDTIVLGTSETVEVDLTIAAIGAAPNDKLARDAGLAVENGILASEQGQTTDAAIFAIGDCAAWFDPELQRHVRLEAVNPGLDQAKIVASLIAASPMPEKRVARYWSHQADIQIQMAGNISSSESEAVLKAPESGAFSVLGLKDGRLVSVQSINAPKQFTKLHGLIGAQRDAVAHALDVEFPPPRH